MIHPFPATAPAIAISVTSTASAAAALGSAPNTGSVVRLVNEGPNRCYVHLAGTGAVATVPDGTPIASATPVLAGEDVILSVSSAQTHISAITRASETATLIVCGAAEGI